MLDRGGEGESFVEFEKDVDVVCDGVNCEAVAVLVGDDAGDVRVQCGADGISDSLLAVFGGEDEVNEIPSEGLWHGWKIFGLRRGENIKQRLNGRIFQWEQEYKKVLPDDGRGGLIAGQ